MATMSSIPPYPGGGIGYQAGGTSATLGPVSDPWSSSTSAVLGDGSGLVTLVEGSSFGISLPSGDMLAGFPHKLFHRDTRFLSTMRLRVNGEWPEPLSTRVIYPFSATMVLRAPPPPGAADSQLLVV